MCFAQGLGAAGALIVQLNVSLAFVFNPIQKSKSILEDPQGGPNDWL